MSVNQTNKIVWLVDTIKRAGKISFRDLNELWKENECLGAACSPLRCYDFGMCIRNYTSVSRKAM